MKYLLSFLILIVFSCNNEPKQEETAVDTTIVQRTPPPFQIVVERPIGARALVADVPLETVTYFQKRTDGKYDTIVRSKFNRTETATATVTYPEWTEVIKPYKEPTTPPVDPPVPSKGYLSLPKSTAQVVTNQSNKVIENLKFEDFTGIGIRITGGSNIIIRNCFFNRGAAEAITIEGATNVTVENCLFNKVTTGVYAISSKTVKVRNNQGVNFRMRLSATGAKAGRGQLTQFNSVGGEGNEVINNTSVCYAGESDPEDHISLFATSNVTVRGNILVGGGPSLSGSGIMTGDNGGSNQLIENNTLVGTGNAGIGVAGGSNIRVLNNKIYSDRTTVSNNPLYVWNQSGKTCATITVTGNFVTWTDKNGNKNNGWNGGGCTGTVYNPTENKPITLAQIGLPANPITFVSDAELLTLRR